MTWFLEAVRIRECIHNELGAESTSERESPLPGRKRSGQGALK
jgi:hypothetical protein